MVLLRRLRGLLKKSAFELQDIDLNETVGEVFAFISDLAKVRGVILHWVPSPKPLRMRGDRGHFRPISTGFAHRPLLLGPRSGFGLCVRNAIKARSGPLRSRA
jgi:hypothetical protein